MQRIFALPSFHSSLNTLTYRIARRLLAVALAATFAPAFASFDECRQFFPNESVPKLATQVQHKARELCFSDFAVLYSATSKTPVYAVERLNKERFEANAKRKRGRNPFYEEARLPSSERSTLEDYRSTLEDGQRFDRGHVVPAGDMTTDEGYAQSFSLANIVPQFPKANQGPWNRIEQDTRKYVRRARGDVYVFTGPVFAGNPQTLGPNKVWIPSAMFKLVYDPSTNRAWAHWLQNSEDARVQAPITYGELTRRIGYKLLNVTPRD